jgi:hypothetical protein
MSLFRHLSVSFPPKKEYIFFRFIISETLRENACKSYPLIGRMPIPVAERSNASVCGHSLVGIAGLNPAGSTDVCVVCCRGVSDKMIKDINVHNGYKPTERKKEKQSRRAHGCLSLVSIDRSFCDGPIPSPEKLYCLGCVIVCDL